MAPSREPVNSVCWFSANTIDVITSGEARHAHVHHMHTHTISAIHTACECHMIWYGRYVGGMAGKMNE